MAGVEVTRSSLDMASSNAVKAWRDAKILSERIFFWLADHPVVENVDPLMQEPYNYSADDAYLLRFVFGGLHDLDTDSPLTAGRKLTALD